MNDETSADQTDLSTSPPLPPYVPPPPLALSHFAEPQERLGRCDAAESLGSSAREEVAQGESSSTEDRHQDQCPAADGCDVIQGKNQDWDPARLNHVNRGRSTEEL